MQRLNPPDAYIIHYCDGILLAMLRMIWIWAIVTLGISDAFSQQTPVVDSTKEKKAWTIFWSEGPVSLTEVWFETTQSTRRLVVFPLCA